MNRFKAAGIHILISFFIVTTVLAAMYLLWYPNEYFMLMGGQKLIVLLACVDIFLGPVLTFVVFKSGKKSLKFDLFCIGVVQFAALSYGVYVLFESRPVFTVFNKNKFQIAAVVDIAPEELAKTKNPHWQKFSITGPELVAVGAPDERNKVEAMFAKVESKNAYHYPRLFDQYNNHRDEVIKAGKPLAILSGFSIENKSTIDRFLNKSNRPESDFLFLPIASELAEMSVIVDAKTAALVTIIDAKTNEPATK